MAEKNKIATAYVQVMPSMEGVAAKVKQWFGGAGDSAGSSFGGSLVGKIKGIVAAAGIGKMLASSISAGADLQQSLGGVETLFKGSADTVIKNAEMAYKTAGMSANQYMENVTSFSASLLQSLGGDTERAASVADMAMTDMSDNANKMGTDMQSIQNAYQGFAKQNYTMLDNLKLGYGGTQKEMERLLADAEKFSGVEYDINNLSDVYEAIHVIQGELDITGTTAKEASSTLSGSLASMKAAFSDFLGNLSMGKDIGAPLHALTDTVFAYMRNLIPMVANILKELPEVINYAFSLAVRGLSTVWKNTDTILQSGLDLVTGIGEAIISAIPYLAESAFNIVGAIGDFILETDWMQVGTDVIASLRSSLDIAAGEILGTDGDIVQSVLDAISSKLPSVLDTGTQIINKLVSGIMSTIPTLVESGLNALTEFINMLIANLPSVLESGKEILLNVVSGIQSALPQIVSAAGNAIASLLSGIVSHLPEILVAGIDLVVSLVAGIGNALPDIIAAGVDLVKKLWDTIINTDWLQLGKDIIRGLINGIGSMAGALWDAAVNVAKSAFDGIKSFFGIHSPSRKMRDEVGKFIPSGIAVGIEANTKPLTDAMHSLSDDTVNAFTVPAVGSRTAPRVQAPTNSITLNVYGAQGQDVDDLAEIVMQKLQFLLSRREAQLA